MINIAKNRRLVKQKRQVFLPAKVPKSQESYQAKILENLKNIEKALNEMSGQFRITVDCMRRFFVPDKEKCEAFLRAQKNVVE